MPRYFIDFRDGNTLHTDNEGCNLKGLREARLEAIALLPEVTCGELADGEHRIFVVTVRNAAGYSLYQATLTFDGRKLALNGKDTTAATTSGHCVL